MSDQICDKCGANLLTVLYQLRVPCYQRFDTGYSRREIHQLLVVSDAESTNLRLSSSCCDSMGGAEKQGLGQTANKAIAAVKKEL